MALNLAAQDLVLAGGGRTRGREFRRIFAASFVIFLVVALVVRLLPASWRPYPLQSDGSGSILSEARAAAKTFVPFVFMG